MGNCSLKAVNDATKDICFVRIMTDSGEVLHLKGPKLVRELLNDFPGYNVFGHGSMSSPLGDHEQLLDGQFYYLLPVSRETSKDPPTEQPENEVRTSSSGALDQLVTSMSKGQSGLEVLPPRQKGVWKVKLVIDSQQLGEILAEEENTEALIEQMRSAARSSAKGRKSWWGGNLKVIFTNVFKVPLENQNKILALDSCSSSPR